MRGAPFLGLCAFGVALAGCLPDPRVTRVYDGKVVQERFVHPDAYSAFLRGVLAEEAGDLKGALAAYTQALDFDDDDPVILARIGEARCKLDPKDGAADKAFGRAIRLDPTSSAAHAGNARCLFARGRTDEAAGEAALAAAADPKNAGLEALYVRSATPKGDAKTRERAIALTLANGDQAAAWDALVTWGKARRDAELVARGYEGLLHAAPARSAEAERAAVLLVDEGRLALARHLAAAIADSPRELGIQGPRDATAARLAVDEALARGDKARALARATRGHVALAEVAARALMLDQRDIASAIATSVVEADPGSSGAQMVKAAMRATGTKPSSQETSAFAHVTDRPPELCALVLAERLASAAGPEVARDWLARIERTPMAPRDPLGGPLANDLVAKGVLPRPTAQPSADHHASTDRPSL